MSPQQPRVTIHMPSFNQGQFLAYALEGALNQSYDDYDVIVSNNHCTDESEAVLARYAGHPRLKVVVPPTFLPAIENFRFAVAQSRSEYFSYLCSDDGLAPDFLKEQVALLDRYPTASFAHSAAQMIGGRGEPLYLEKSIHKTGLTPAKDAFERFIHGARCVGDSVLFRRHKFEEVGGFGDLYALDWEVELLLCTVGDVAYNQNVLMQYRLWDAPARTVPNQLRLMNSVRELYAKYEPRFPEHAATFKKARLEQALAFVNSLQGMERADRTSAVATIHAISSSPLVEAKIRAFDLGLGRAFIAMTSLRHRSRRLVKSLLYPLVAPSRT